jgi:hypothetical protein
MIETILICAVVCICIYVYAVYARSGTPIAYNDDEYDYVEGYKGRRRKTGNSKKSDGEKTEAAGGDNPSISPPSGVGSTAPIFHQNITLRMSGLGEELNMQSYEPDYLGIVDDMIELMYRKALKSCLSYTDVQSDKALIDMNNYIHTADSLKKVYDWMEAPNKKPTSSTPAGSTQKTNSSTSWF